ncbi:unnamed protein product [Closterium sp. NIES-65]|nr:unnamed protein product [Closterium sp. NIES-65]
MDGTGQCLQPQIKSLTRAGFDIRALYIPMSDRSTWRQLVRRVAPLIQQAANEEDAEERGASGDRRGREAAREGAREVTVLAESFGACLALRIAAANPGLLHRLVLVSEMPFLLRCLPHAFCIMHAGPVAHPLPSLSSPFFLPLLPPSFFGRFPFSPLRPCPLPPCPFAPCTPLMPCHSSPSRAKQINPATAFPTNNPLVSLSCPFHVPPRSPRSLVPFPHTRPSNLVPSRSTQQRPSPPTTRSSASPALFMCPLAPLVPSSPSPTPALLTSCQADQPSNGLPHQQPARQPLCCHGPACLLPAAALRIRPGHIQSPRPSFPLSCVLLSLALLDVALPLLVKRSRVQPAAAAAGTSVGGGEASLRVLSPIDYVPAACASWRLSLLNDQSGLSDAVLRSIHAPTLLAPQKPPLPLHHTSIRLFLSYSPAMPPGGLIKGQVLKQAERIAAASPPLILLLLSPPPPPSPPLPLSPSPSPPLPLFPSPTPPNPMVAASQCCWRLIANGSRLPPSVLRPPSPPRSSDLAPPTELPSLHAPFRRCPPSPCAP